MIDAVEQDLPAALQDQGQPEGQDQLGVMALPLQIADAGSSDPRHQEALREVAKDKQQRRGSSAACAARGASGGLVPGATLAAFVARLRGNGETRVFCGNEASPSTLFPGGATPSVADAKLANDSQIVGQFPA
ncbi:hypothetical protein [Teichococcus oryzae]|uniref:Uncharacterized protein n=1 Tax=Teichococcus oryzae TaxID=1608942 RepID=A0A5B2TEN6_9PROT|nr:hypothetical protein [Pseudoroseomonas oryzae]KAA2212573.1 hypothetical protein F0Q34_14725 [Pseudoroseomonas oryzae]